MENIIDIKQLQAYVDANDALHSALGVAPNTPLPLRPFAQGEYNANYAFDVDGENGVSIPLLLRVNLGSQMHLEHQIEYEMEALRLLESSGRVPRVWYVDGSCANFPYGVGVEDRLPGRPLRYETDLELAAQILSDVHAVQVPEACHLVRPDHPIVAIVEECEQMFAAYCAWSKADPTLIESMNRLFEKAREVAQRDAELPAPARLCIVNTEVNSSNFLINDGAGERSYLIDWEKPVLGEPAQDLAHFLVPTTTYWKTTTILDRSQMEAFVGAYLAHVAGRFDTAGLQERLDDYLTVTCLRGLSWCAMALAEYEGGARASSNADTYAKIKEYLQPNFLAFIARDYYGL